MVGVGVGIAHEALKRPVHNRLGNAVEGEKTGVYCANNVFLYIP
jgi:hypothetical protein